MYSWCSYLVCCSPATKINEVPPPKRNKRLIVRAVHDRSTWWWFITWYFTTKAHVETCTNALQTRNGSKPFSISVFDSKQDLEPFLRWCMTLLTWFDNKILMLLDPNHVRYQFILQFDQRIWRIHTLSRIRGCGSARFVNRREPDICSNLYGSAIIKYSCCMQDAFIVTLFVVLPLPKSMKLHHLKETKGKL